PRIPTVTIPSVPRTKGPRPAARPRAPAEAPAAVARLVGQWVGRRRGEPERLRLSIDADGSFAAELSRPGQPECRVRGRVQPEADVLDLQVRDHDCDLGSLESFGRQLILHATSLELALMPEELGRLRSSSDPEMLYEAWVYERE